MPIWGWVCIGLTVAAVILIVVLNIKMSNARKYTLENGEPVIGWLVQANNNLFEKGIQDYPAVVLISPDPKSADDEEYMTELASDIMSLKGEDCDDDDEEFVSSLVTDEAYVEGKRTKLPKSFTDRPNIYLCHVYIYRDDLPKKRLTQNYVCCSIIWDEPGTLICSRPWKGRKKSKRQDDESDDED